MKKKVIAFLLIFLLLSSCSKSHGNKTILSDYTMDSIYSVNEQQFCLGDIVLPLNATDLAAILKQNQLAYTVEKDEIVENYEQWKLNTPIKFMDYQASLVFSIYTAAEPFVVEQIVLLIEADDLALAFETITRQATSEFGADSLTTVGEKTMYYWIAYSKHGIVKENDELPNQNEIAEKWGNSSSLRIVLNQEAHSVTIIVH